LHNDRCGGASPRPTGIERSAKMGLAIKIAYELNQKDSLCHFVGRGLAPAAGYGRILCAPTVIL